MDNKSTIEEDNKTDTVLDQSSEISQEIASTDHKEETKEDDNYPRTLYWYCGPVLVRYRERQHFLLQA